MNSKNLDHQFPDSLEFQSWKVNFKTEIRANSVLPQITMHWIKEVEIAKSINYERFRATGAYEAVQGLSYLFTIRLQNDDVQDFDTRWDQALFSSK